MLHILLRSISVAKIHNYPFPTNISSHIHHPHLVEQLFIASLVEAVITCPTSYPQPIELCALSLCFYYGLLNEIQGKEEKIWAFALKEYAKEIPGEIEREIFHFEGIDYLDDDYTIENVTIDRRSLTITLTDKAEGKTSDYCIDIRKYPFLRTLLPSDLVSIIRLLSTDEVSFQWPLKGYVIPMKEFEIKEG